MNPRQAVAVDRREFVAALLAKLPDALVITGLGSPTYDVFAAGDRDRNFYLWGAMGGAAIMGLGLAIAQPGQQVLVITGDGEQLMGLGGLSTIGAQQPKNLSVVVLDNGHFGETGMQRSHTSLGTDLAAVARACGIGKAFRVDDMAGVDRVAEAVLAREGACFAQVIVKADDLPRALPSRDGVHVKNRFRQSLGLDPL
ncbi:thiamine pyrophosphate-dependent enzyme [Zeimonas arvi]|uniref:thiamine pyrophosphate-dependent enzyme n=1 Tax=Zeimonas arvi TaxID=2498847 RepID=UPI002B40021A|nr:thiamine pyrophosphate-dependent enzyme [Zeimonas arvi]